MGRPKKIVSENQPVVKVEQVDSTCGLCGTGSLLCNSCKESIQGFGESDIIDKAALDYLPEALKKCGSTRESAIRDAFALGLAVLKYRRLLING